MAGEPGHTILCAGFQVRWRGVRKQGELEKKYEQDHVGQRMQKRSVGSLQEVE